MVYVAEGTYGCVYRPPIKCKNGIKYPNGKISKLMTRRAAIKEEKEYKLIKKADKKQKYYPGPPIRCDPDPVDATNEMTPGECKLFEKDPNINKYNLLIYNDGGHDLKQFIEHELDNYLAAGSQEQTDKFFLNAYNLFQGIKLFLANNILHHDIKPQNIVFDSANHRFNYIDFGLIEQKSKMVNGIIAGNNHESFHLSYPLEFGFLDSVKDYDFNKITNFSPLQKDFIKILNDPAYENKSNKYGIKPRSFQTVFKYMEDRIHPFSKTKFINQMFDGLVFCKAYYTFPEFVEKLLKNTDIYSLGFTLNHVLNSFFDKGAITRADYIKYSKLFRKMCSPNLNGRTEYSIDEYADEYERILTETGVLSRLDKTISNGEIKDANESFESELMNTTLTRIRDILKRCPPGQELNSATRRCRKVCPPNHYRDTNGKCKKMKNASQFFDYDVFENSSSKKTQKVCPPGKEINYATGRCRIQCKPGTMRNSKGRCVRELVVPL
jgi:serine/threonine protein kinase